MIRLNDILEEVRTYNADIDCELLEKAYVFSAKVHKGEENLAGEPYLNHPLEVGYLLARLKMDVETVVTGLVHDTLEENLTDRQTLKSLFGDVVAELVDGVTQIGRMSFRNVAERQAENFRKMLLATARDIRVVIVKLADRLDNMRLLPRQPEAVRRQVAQETFDIYAPLANRLGISWIKCDLEDYSFRFLMPEVYYELASRVAKKKRERDEYIDEAKRKIEQKLAEHGLVGKVTGRAKHLYSIYLKMERQGIDFDQVYDLAAFRIIVRELSECYAVLGIIHSTWKPIPGRFKDYIAMPKANMYQSLHTTVIGPYGERMEVQIRTEQMHRVAEEGIAAHWMYKEGRVAASAAAGESGQLAWLRKLLEWQQELTDSREFMRSVKFDLLSDSVFVFTPTGEVKELPKGSTPIDFAYSVHSQLGDHCTGAKVDGRLVPLRTELVNGNIVEIVSSTNQKPSKDWLNFAKTTKARNKIRQWIKTEERGKSIEIGKELLEKELRRHGMALKKTLMGEPFQKAIHELGFKGEEDVLAALGYGKVTLGQIVSRVLPEEERAEAAPSLPPTGIAKPRPTPSSSAIRIHGLDNVLFRFAKCCNPLPGDSAIGFITRGRGITVHTADCPHIAEEDPERCVEVTWDQKENANRSVKIRVLCHDRKGVLAAITGAITDSEANIVSATITSRNGDQGINLFEIEVNDLNHLNKVFNALMRVKDVYKVERVRS
ncbi:MAG: bifunctional (p)ppGpp synthetase/guanosine-3',5'-bis(diphosphate) 3'-pyrophosphohydrolase [Deltaproteobacteria bacterium]|nr:bifunctional (p)ppGpp synthetase/guanosine-3',5'-bis(diphosphate) 3'-pyrophosphohydrolase [Deltaproteobacteria bacterium]